jgi:hypothetical protein
VDDLTLLTPTPYARRKIIQIFHDYAHDHDVIFKASKSKYIHSIPSVKHMPGSRSVFFVNNPVTECVDSWPHLGNISSQNQNAFNLHYHAT